MYRISHPGLVAAMLAIALLLVMPAQADETIEVDYRGCNLNDAIRAANTNQPVGGCRAGDPGHDHIFVDGIVEILERPVVITEDLAIVGDRDTSTLDGQGRFSFFHVGPGIDLHIQDIFLSNGYGTRESGQSRVERGGRIYFSTASIINCKGVKEVVAAEDTLVHIGHAASICGKMEPFNPHPPVLPPPNPDDRGDPPARRPDTPRPITNRAANAPAKGLIKPAAYTCEHLPANMRVRAVAGTRSGIQCQAIGAAGVGLPSIIDLGIISAVDIWGWVAPGVEVCLRGRGSLLFLDSAYAPQRVSSIVGYAEADMTCAEFTRAGSLVLVQASADPSPAERSLQGCDIRTLDMLRLRNAPAGSVVFGLVPAGLNLKPDAFSGGWFRVWYAGVQGWISADYVETRGNCA